MPFDPKKLKQYPKDPGVYLMKDLGEVVLYVGKAKNLRSRLRQYFAEKGDERAQIPYLTSEVFSIDTIVVTNEKEALLLENTLIKRHKPKYNILLKDDKTYINLMLTKHEWPMLQLIRYKGKPKNKGTYFGPYTNAKAAREIFDLIQKLFPLRQCSDAELRNRTRPCLLYDIKRCIAPCVGKCTKREYEEHVKAAGKLLRGQDKEVVRTLKKEMQKASEAMEFERAQSLLEILQQIEHVTEVQHVDNPAAKDCDVLGLFREDAHVMIAKLLYRSGKLVASEHFSFSFIASDNEEILQNFILQHYKLEKPPSEIFLPIALPQKHSIEEILQEHSAKKVQISTPQKGNKKKLIIIAQKNAEVLFIREQDARSLNEKRLLDLQETLKLTRFPRRIECFDTSNISGVDPVACMVTFVNGQKETNRMKLFKIRGGKTDDYSALREVLIRHYTKEKEKKDFCDLVIMDGGKGHLNLALDVFKELNIASIDVIAVAKESALHTKSLTKEKVFVPYQKDPLIIDPYSPMLFLLQRIRDEAHRVAIGFHRRRRSKRTISSSLDSLEGIGPVKKKRLLQHFGSMKQIQSASREELEKVSGLTKKDIDKLLEWNS